MRCVCGLVEVSSSLFVYEGHSSRGCPVPQEQKASKNDKEKPDLALIPAIALEAEARAFMVGEKKYGRYNFYKGHTASQLIAALIRHATAWNEGEENDPIDGQPHLGSVRACAAMLLQQQKLGTLKDNRYKKGGDDENK